MSNVVKLRPDLEQPPDYSQVPPPAPAFIPRIEVPKGCEVEGFEMEIPIQPAMPVVARLENLYETFFEMCRPSLWGTELEPNSAPYRDFGEMLRDLMLEYQPRSRSQLELLAIVADKQWKVKRVRLLQQGIFNAQPNDRGKYGVSRKSETAMDYEKTLNDYIADLGRAIALYRNTYG